MVERDKVSVLVISPHMDDEVLGVGGTIARHVTRGDMVNVCVVAHRAYSHLFDEEKNRVEMTCTREARKILGYNETVFMGLPDEKLTLHETLVALEEQIKWFDPEIVYIPHRGDLNQDHRIVFQAASIALRPHASTRVKGVYCYEVPSSTDQAPPFPEYAFLPNRYVNIEDTIEKKIQALHCYKTENRPFPHPRSTEGLITTARMRGMESGLMVAEAFVVVREKWD